MVSIMKSHGLRKEMQYNIMQLESSFFMSHEFIAMRALSRLHLVQRFFDTLGLLEDDLSVPANS